MNSSRLVTTGCIGAGIGAALFGIGPLAHADQDPVDCSAAGLESVRSGVSAATSAYLVAHPDVNAFYTGLKGVPRDQVSAKVQAYMAAHPDVKADMTGIRQPLQDIKNRCAAPPPPSS